MANGKNIKLPEIADAFNTQDAPLDQNLLPDPPKSLDIKLPEIKDAFTSPATSGIPGFEDIFTISPEEKRERDVARRYGVTPGRGINIQESAAIAQSNWQKWRNGFGKMVGTAATTFLEPFADIFVGIPTAAITGRVAGVYDNPISNTLDNLNEFIRTELPNYYTQAENDYGFWKSLGTANFWSDQGLQGVGFLAGAIFSGTSIAASNAIGYSAKAASLAGIKSWRNVTNSFRSSQIGKTAAELSKVRDLLGRVNYSAQAANMWGSGLASAFGEAGIEARETRKRSIDLMKELRSLGDARYADLSDDEITDLADTAGNVAFSLNTAIVGGSNIYQFGKLFSRSWKSTSGKYLDDLLESKIADGKLRYKFKDLPKAWKKYYEVVNWFKRPAAEAFEEWSQASINVASEDYFEDVFSPVPWKGLEELLEGSLGITGSLMRGYTESAKTKEGQQAIFLGALLGKLGEAGQSFRKDGMSSRQEWLKTYDRTEQLAKTLNLLEPESKLYTLLRGFNESVKSQAELDKALEAGDIFTYKNIQDSSIFSLIDTFIDANKIEDLKSFLQDMGKLSEEEFKEVIGIDPKTQIKSPSEQTRIIEERIKFIEDEKPRIDLFVSTLDKPDLEKVNISRSIRYYSYMADTLDKREEDLARKLSTLTDGTINWEGLRGFTKDNEERVNAFAEMQEAFSKSDTFVDFIRTQANVFMTDLNNLQKLRESYLKKIEKATSFEAFEKAKKASKAVNNNIKQSENKGNVVKNEITVQEEDVANEQSEDSSEKEALKPVGTKRQRKLARLQAEREKKIKKLKDDPEEGTNIILTETEEQFNKLRSEMQEQEDKRVKAQKAKSDQREQQQKAKEDEKSFDTFKFVKQRVSELLDEEIDELIAAEEAGVDYDLTRNEKIGDLLAANDNKPLKVRYRGKKGILFKDFYTMGETVIKFDKSGVELVMGQNLDEDTLADHDIELMLDQGEVISEADKQPLVEDSGIDEGNTESIEDKEKIVDSDTFEVNSADTKDSAQISAQSNIENPTNEDVSETNDENNKGQSDTYKEDTTVSLSSMQSLAWKSDNHRTNYGLTDPPNPDITNFLENKKNKDGLEITFKIDLDDPQIKDIREMQAIADKLKQGKSITEEELGKLAIVAEIKDKDGKIYKAYLHRSDYVNKHIEPTKEAQEAAKKLNMNDRKIIYKNWQNGKDTKTTIKEVTRGHLVTNKDIPNTPKDKKQKVKDILDKGETGVGFMPPKISIAANGIYIDENNEQTFKNLNGTYLTLKKDDIDGAVFIEVTAANGQPFPLRVFTENLNEYASEFIYKLYRQALLDHNGDITKSMSLEFYNNLFSEDPNAAIINSLLTDVVEQFRPSQNVGPTYRQVLDLLIFQGSGTKSKVSPTLVVGRNELKFGEKKYDTKKVIDNESEIVSWLKNNKRYHVNKEFINSKVTNNAYNNWLVDNNIIYTDAIVGNTTTGSLFVQPTVRYNPLKEEIESEPKLKDVAQQIDPKDLPSDLKKSLDKQQGKGVNTNNLQNLAGVRTPYDMSDQGIQISTDNDLKNSLDNQTCK